MTCETLPGSVSESRGPEGSYFGGKGAAGTYQTLVNEIPPHDVYVAPFLGFDSVLRRLKPARETIGCELDPQALSAWARYQRSGLRIYQTDGIAWLRHYFDLDLVHGGRPSAMPPAIAAVDRRGGAGRALEVARILPPDPEAAAGDAVRCGVSSLRHFVFADPPYPHSTRSSDRYAHELTDERHAELLQVLRATPAMVMVCSYPNELYAELLADWRTFTYLNSTRGGQVTEQAWCNYAAPAELHDSRYVGRNRRERERIRRRCRNWRRELQSLSAFERQAIMDEITGGDDCDG